MPKIKIFRKKDWFIRYKVFEIWLDGQKAVYLSNGETIEFEAPSGEHQLKIKMGWINSKIITFTLYQKDSLSLSPFIRKIQNHLPFQGTK